MTTVPLTEGVTMTPQWSATKTGNVIVNVFFVSICKVKFHVNACCYGHR